MSDHTGHWVKWMGNGQVYRLYCFTCGAVTAHKTEQPNTQEKQRFEQATADPGAITITLQVNSLKHRNQSNWRQNG